MAETKRVIYYDQLDNNRPTSGDVIFVDNPTTGTHKMDLKSFVDAINNGFDSSIKSSGVSVSADNYSSIITNVNDQPVNSIYTYGAGLQSKVSNLPSNKAMTIVNLAQKSTGGLGQVMLAVERNGSGDYLYFRTIGGSPAVWSSWVKVANNSDVEAVREALDNLDIETDKTLSVDGKPADAKAAGDEINDLKADLSETTKNLFEEKYTSFNGLELNDGEIVNTLTDTRTSFFFTVLFRNTETIITSNTKVISDNGRAEISFTPSSSGNNLLIKHNGDVKNLTCIVPFNFVGGTTYTVSVNVESHNPSVVGGLILSDIQIEVGDEATYYIPHISAKDFKARHDIVALDEKLSADVSDLKSDLKSDLNGIIDISFSEYDGYFNANGVIVSPSASAQEKYTEKLSVNSGDILKFNIDYTSSVGIWVAYATYTENGTFIERTILGDLNGNHFDSTVSIPDGVGFVVFTYRTWGTATTTISCLTSLYNISVSAKNIGYMSELSTNLFGGTFSGLGNFSYANKKLTNIATDTYEDFHFQIHFKNGSTIVDYKTIEVNFTGRVRITIETNGSGDNIDITHSGRTKNFSAIIPFSFTSGQTYTVSLTVENYDVSTIGGLVLSDIQIEEGDSNTPYIPVISAIDYVARTQIDNGISEKDLNVLLMGDSIFGNDGEIALFLDEMLNSCVNGAFGGTRVSVRSYTSDGFRFFDGVNIITALCTQAWTDQDTAASSLSSTYPWITARLAGLKAVDMSKIDLLIMDWGTNDYTAGATIEDITTAYNTVIDLLQTTYPELRILITTPIWRYWGTESDNENGDNKVYNVSTLKEIALAIEEFMKNKRISVLNAYQNLPLSYKTAPTYFDANDKTHLNTFGNKVYAYLLHGKIRSIY